MGWILYNAIDIDVMHFDTRQQAEGAFEDIRADAKADRIWDDAILNCFVAEIRGVVKSFTVDEYGLEDPDGLFTDCELVQQKSVD